MFTVNKIITLIILFVFTRPAFSDIPGFIQYIFPEPGSGMVSPRTTLILRLKARWQTTVGPDHIQISMTGGSSGAHAGTFYFAADGKTMIFKPQHQFADHETVSVIISVDHPQLGSDLAFQFTTGGDQNPLNGSAGAKSTVQNITGNEVPAKIYGEMSVINGVSVPGDFPKIDVITMNQTASGKLFYANGQGFPNPYVVICENDGTPYYYQRLSYSAAQDFKVQPTGTLTMWVPNQFFELDSTFTHIKTYRAGHGYLTDDHELQLLPNGNFLIIAVDIQTVDMSQIVDGGNPYASVRGYHMQEIDHDGNVLLEWRCWDHFNILDAEHIDPTASVIDYVHMNSVAIDYDNNILISSRNLSEITKINRQTGAIIWRLGGVHNQFEWINDADGISYQHDIRPVSGQPGHYTVFDNGAYHSPSFSRALEFAVDTLNMTVTKVWEYRHTPDRYTPWRGNAQRLPNGNTLIDWAYYTLPKATEVSPDGTIVYEMDINETTWVYRTFRFNWQGNARVPYLLAEAYTDRVVLIFNKFGDESVDHYVIYGGTAPHPVDIIGTTARTWLDLTDLINGQRYYFRVTAVSGDSESEFSNEVNTVAHYIKRGANLIQNGDFSQQNQYWKFSYSGGAQAAGEVVDGNYHATILNGGSTIGQIVLEQDNIELRQNRTYRLTFDGRSDPKRPVEVRLQMGFYPNTDYTRFDVGVFKPDWQKFQYEFTMNEPTNIASQLILRLGVYPANVYFDNIDLREINLAPVIISALPDRSFREDSGMQLITDNLNDVFTDPDSGAGLVYSVSSQNPRIKGMVIDSSLFIRADSNYYGAGEIILTATDETDLSVSDTFLVMISNINDPPHFTGLPDSIEFSQDSTYAFNLSEMTADIDSPDSVLQFTFTSSTGSLHWTYNRESGILNLFSENTFSGPCRLFMTVTDDSGAYCTDSLRIFILETNDNEPPLIPDHFVLFQNYPNPFNSSTNIKVGLPETSTIIVEIFNSRGQKISEVINEEKPAGYQTVAFDAAGLPSGLYFYRLRAKNFQQVKKMMLIR